MDTKDILVGFVTTSLIQLFSNMIKGATEKVGESAGESFYALLKKKFKKGSYEHETLERLKEDPESKTRKNIFDAVLREQIEADPNFEIQLLEIQEKQFLLEETKITVTQEISQVTGNVVQIIGNVTDSHFFDKKISKK